MANLRVVRVPLLERVVLEQLAVQWQVTVEEVLARLIREAAHREVMSRTPCAGEHLNEQSTEAHDE